MNENQDDKGIQQKKIKFTAEERRNYYMAWKESGMSHIAFCKAKGISKSVLYKWIKKFKKENNGRSFAPLILKKPLLSEQTDVIQLNMNFPNQIKLSIAMPEQRLVSFIQELSHATAIIR